MGIHYGKADFINYGKPSLLLDFARNKSLVDRISGNNLITFTRSSVGTYVGADGLIKTASADEPRFDHNPSTGESLGLLIEESRTNLILDSNLFTSPPLSFTNISVVENTNETISPDGTYTAAKITDNSTTGQHTFIRSYPTLSGNLYTSSIYIKQGTQRYVSILAPTATSTKIWATYDLQNGTIVAAHVSSVATITPHQNGWYRCTIRTNSSANANALLQVSFNSTGINPSWPVTTQPSDYSGSGDYFYVWGMQGELGSFPTSYIPTSGSTVTRSADSASITGTNFSSWFNNNEGTIILNMSEYKSTSLGSFSISFGSAYNNYLAFPYINGSGTLTGQVYYRDSSITEIAELPDGSIVGKYGVVYEKGTRLTAYFNGVLGQDAPGPFPNPSDFVSLFMGRSHFVGGAYHNIHIKQLLYYPKSIINTQLQELTAQ